MFFIPFDFNEPFNQLQVTHKRFHYQDLIDFHKSTSRPQCFVLRTENSLQYGWSSSTFEEGTSRIRIEI